MLCAVTVCCVLCAATVCCCCVLSLCAVAVCCVVCCTAVGGFFSRNLQGLIPLFSVNVFFSVGARYGGNALREGVKGAEGSRDRGSEGDCGVLFSVLCLLLCCTTVDVYAFV